MKIITVVVGAFEVNCYIVSGESDEAIVIDPGGDAADIKRALDSEGLSVVLYVLTHGHIDHISALWALLAEYPAPVAIHPEDLTWAFSERNAMPPYPAPGELPRDVREFEPNKAYTDAGLTYRVLHTPGHTKGGVCLHVEAEKILFTGDTLFAGSVGRTDFPGGDARELKEALTSLAELPDETRIYPGHGPGSAIGQEKRTNFFMNNPF